MSFSYFKSCDGKLVLDGQTCQLQIKNNDLLEFGGIPREAIYLLYLSITSQQDCKILWDIKYGQFNHRPDNQHVCKIIFIFFSGHIIFNTFFERGQSVHALEC